MSGTVPFHDKLPKLKLQIFTSLTKSVKVKLKNKGVIMKADSKFFARMLVIAQSRAMDLRHVLKFSIGPVPWSLATPEEQMRKTMKAALLHLLEKDVQALESAPHEAARMVDGMALLQSVPCSPCTFDELAVIIFNMVTSTFKRGGRQVEFVTDQYLNISVKGVSTTNGPQLDL